MTIDILNWGQVAAAIMAMVGLIAGVIKISQKPIKDLSEKHDKEILDTHLKLTDHDKRIEVLEETRLTHAKQIEESLVQRALTLEGVLALLEDDDEATKEAKVRINEYFRKKPFEY